MNLVSLFCILLAACIYFHDDGTPDSLSDSEKHHVLSVLDQYHARLDDVIGRIENFAKNPDPEADAAQELLQGTVFGVQSFA